jgi:hypothetical protein
VALQKTTPITLSPLISSIKTLCTPDTTLVSALNPLLLEYTLGHTCKTIVPFDRSVEFASHAVIKKYGDKPHAEEDSRNYSLRNQGTDVYEATFSEHPVRGRFLFETSALSKEQIISAQTLLDLQPTSIPSLFWAQTKHTSVDK